MELNKNPDFRQIELTQMGSTFLNEKNKIPRADDPNRIVMKNALKERLLRIFNADEEDWNDWIWQMQHRITSVDSLCDVFNISVARKSEIESVSLVYRFAVSPYYLTLFDINNENSIVEKMVLPSRYELENTGVEDPSNETFSSPTSATVRRYPDRMIINVTNSCASYCRHCQRRRLIGTTDTKTSLANVYEAIRYIKLHTEIRDVILTGGDALTLEDEELDLILSEIRQISHVEIIRIGTRAPVTLPQRITDKFVEILKKYTPIYLNTQFNHPLELTSEAKISLKKLADNGIILCNQMVLLKGINDDKYIVRLLNQELLRERVRPYYIFHTKPVKGILHFQTTIDAGIEIIKYLRGNTSGLAIPTYVVSAPQGRGKIALSPNYMLEENNDSLTLATWEGKIINVNQYNLPI
jgi:lysine 2,3-aminomutase